MPALHRITRNPAVRGKPCLRGMRATAGAIVGLVASGGLKILADINLSPLWVPFLNGTGVGFLLAPPMRMLIAIL